MTELYPLLFTPVFMQRVWGGRKLAAWFREMPEGPVGEAWVLSGHPQGPTPVANGPLAGETLSSLQERFGAALLGTRGLAAADKGFPLLFKLLDCQDDLSVQVHPDDHYEGLPPGERGKTEMWVVLHADPGAQVVYGLRPGVTANDFGQAVSDGRTMDVMRTLPVQAGDVLFVPAGTVHALGKGLVVAEIQQSSDTTYRVYDYDRPGLDGKPRPLHVDHALRVTGYGEPPAPGSLPPAASGQWTVVADSPYFTVSYGTCKGSWEQETTPESFHALLPITGSAAIRWGDRALPVPAGAVVLIPPALERYALEGDCAALLVTIPA